MNAPEPPTGPRPIRSALVHGVLLDATDDGYQLWIISQVLERHLEHHMEAWVQQPQRQRVRDVAALIHQAGEAWRRQLQHHFRETSERGTIGGGQADDGQRLELMTTGEYAAMKGCTARWVRQQCDDGLLPARKIGGSWIIAVGEENTSGG